MAHLGDFSVLNTRVLKYQEHFKLQTPNQAFMHVALDTILKLTTEEIKSWVKPHKRHKSCTGMIINC
jgi:hypothetical protein